MSSRKYIFIVGGVLSGVGKGVTCASLGAIFTSKGFRVTAVKADPYINVDAGTMNPIEHGEVFVTNDGDETDQDIGNYERFLNMDLSSVNYMTTGRVYRTVIEAERAMKYNGKCVQVVPHIPEEIIRRIRSAAEKNNADITLIEIGGTVGEYENILFLEAARMMKLHARDDVAFVLVSYLPVPSHLGEMKTKPTQHAARALNSAGINADMIIARGPFDLDSVRLEKLAVFCGVEKSCCISAPDLPTIYDVPLKLESQGVGNALLSILDLKRKRSDLSAWERLVHSIHGAEREVKIAVVGKYFGTGEYTLADSYISVIEAVKHASWTNGAKPVLEWIDSEGFEKDEKTIETLKSFDGIIVPGGFGHRGVLGIVRAIQFAREEGIPYFGLCYGMQLACIEAARHIAKLLKANTTEIDPETADPIIHANPLQAKNIVESRFGGTMRLGAYDCTLENGSLSFSAYGKRMISERHRHRYEFNNAYRAMLVSAGFRIAGINPESNLVEIIELRDHPFFVGTQFHPEFTSRPMVPHPLFYKFIAVALSSNRDVSSRHTAL